MAEPGDGQVIHKGQQPLRKDERTDQHGNKTAQHRGCIGPHETGWKAPADLENQHHRRNHPPQEQPQPQQAGLGVNIDEHVMRGRCKPPLIPNPPTVRQAAERHETRVGPEEFVIDRP